PAADHRGRHAVDADRRPLPRARLVRPRLGPGDHPGLRESPRLVALAGRHLHGVRHHHHHVARRRRATRDRLPAGPCARARGVRVLSAPGGPSDARALRALCFSGAPRPPSLARGSLVFLLALVLATSAAIAATQQEVEESLTCQCGCGLTVHSCNHLQCQSGEPMKKEIAERLAAGQDKATILAAFRDRYGEKILSAPTFHGFNWFAWVTPFALLFLGALSLTRVLRRWTRETPAPAPPAPAPAGAALRPPPHR